MTVMCSVPLSGRLELLGSGVECEHGVAAEVAHPHDVALVHIHRVRFGACARQFPLAPGARGRIVHRQVPAVPFAYPDAPLAVAPDTARALVARRRLHHGRVAGAPVDTRDERAGQGTPPDIATRGSANAVGTAAARRFLDADLPALHRHLAHVPTLAGEPQVAVAVECAGVEAGIWRALGQGEDLQLAVGPADANDGVLSAVGDPRCLVGPLDHAVRRRARAQGDEFGAAGLGVEPSQMPTGLRREPDAAIGRRRQVVDAGAAGRSQGPGLHLSRLCISRRQSRIRQGGGARNQEGGASCYRKHVHLAQDRAGVNFRPKPPGPSQSPGAACCAVLPRRCCCRAPCWKSRIAATAPTAPSARTWQPRRSCA
jgi:hypothetical protein